jgi:2-haloacid dehalogenase
MSFDPAHLRALVFDIGGSVFDWMTSIRNAWAPIQAQHRIDLDADRFARDWRSAFLDYYTDIAEGRRPFVTADRIVADTLPPLLDRHRAAALDESDRAALTESWHRMPAWPEAPAALARLRRRFLIAPFTILTFGMAAECSKRAGIAWDGILSCDLLGVYKPNPRAYARVCEVLNLEPRVVMKVAAHPGDLRSARRHGFRTAYVVSRLDDPGDDYGDPGLETEFDVYAKDFADLADQMDA